MGAGTIKAALLIFLLFFFFKGRKLRGAERERESQAKPSLLCYTRPCLVSMDSRSSKSKFEAKGKRRKSEAKDTGKSAGNTSIGKSPTEHFLLLLLLKTKNLFGFDC